MIRGYCVTLVKGAEKLTWPTEFVGVPRVGDMVSAWETGKEFNHQRVCSVTHTMEYVPDEGRVALIIVELNK